MNLRTAIAVAAERLATNYNTRETAARDAELLLLHQLRLSRADLRAHPERPLAPPEQAAFQAALARRLANEPVQYITGRQEFFGLLFQITPAVLIPRPETEHLVEAVLDRLPKHRPLRLLDVGTGSGILAVTLATHLPLAAITAVDLSPAALAIARRNAEIHVAPHHIRFLQSDLLASVANERFDCIVSNPPYIPETDRPTLHPQVRDHEPPIALFAGPDGLAIYRRLIPQAQKALLPDGLFAMEIGFGQQPALQQLLRAWKQVQFAGDLQGIPRVALAQRA